MSQEVSLRGTGGAIFAGILLIIGGVLWLLQGLAGIVRGSSYIKGANTLITTSAGTCRWIHLIGGIIGVAAGFGIFSGAAWARLLGILIANLSIMVNFTFIPLQPWWALTIIFIDLWVIHALFVHRRSTRALEDAIRLYLATRVDPGENFNLFNTRLDMTWMFSIAALAAGEFEKSVAQYPNIKPGQEFDGYPAPAAT